MSAAWLALVAGALLTVPALPLGGPAEPGRARFRSPLGWALVGLVGLYRLVYSARASGSCRFEPSCSSYALEALGVHGALRGGWLTVARLARCQPLCAGGYDPVPPRRRGTSHNKIENDDHAAPAGSGS